MSNRAGWNGQDPNHNAELWEVWDAFEIEKANMFGWWNESSPVQVEQQSGHRNRDGDDEGVFATAYVKAGNVTLVAVAMWGTEDLDVTLIIDWAALGLSPETGRVVAPALPGYNNITEPRSFPPAASGDSSRVPVPVKVYEGWLLMLSD